jgi:HNH endonuclease/AP2 domain
MDASRFNSVNRGEQQMTFGRFTTDDLRALFEYNPDTGVIRWISTDKRGRQAGWVMKDGYRYIQLEGKLYLSHRVAWALHYGAEPDGSLDHINSRKSDNRISNLRIATVSENNRNRLRQSNNTSGFKGVTLNKRTGRYNATLTVDKETHRLGTFATAEEAAFAYRDAAERLHGDFANCGESPDSEENELDVLISDLLRAETSFPSTHHKKMCGDAAAYLASMRALLSAAQPEETEIVSR